MAAQATGQSFPSIEQIKANPIPSVRGKRPTIELALDLSSSCIGWAVGADRKVARFGKFVFKSTAGIGEKLCALEEWLLALLLTFMPDRLLIEKVLSRRGNTTQRHAEVLGIVRKVWYEITATELLDSWLISSVTVKNIMKVKRGANHDQNKRIMVDKVNQLYSLGLRFDPNSKYKSDDDTADALAVLTTYWRKFARGT